MEDFLTGLKLCWNKKDNKVSFEMFTTLKYMLLVVVVVPVNRKYPQALTVGLI